jgi:hypothetical protein
VRGLIVATIRHRLALIALGLCVCLASIALLIGAHATPAVAALPNDNVHLGAASCAGSTCHGRQVADGKVVRQDELARWQEPSTPGGAHSRAFAVLSEPRGRQIAARLGIGPATAAPECLGCHTDYPAANLRGAQWRASDGVGCEGCHGGAQPWIASHTAIGGTHPANVARGLVPLDRPAVKAAVCLDCHYGSADGNQFVSHRIMAAGHPRISFELDLFSTLTQHHNEDADYTARKGRTNNVRVWAVGQAMALDRALSLYANPTLGTNGAFPELYFYDCHSCHRPIEDAATFSPSVVDNPSRPVPPGTVPFNDENMIMLAAAAKITAPALAARLDADSRAFHRANTESRAAAIAAGTKLRATAQALAQAFGATGFDRGQTLALINTIAGEAISPRFTDYAGSAQSVMAVDTLLNAMVSAGQMPPGAAQAVRGDINRAYAAVRDPNDYRPLEFRRALGGAVRTIGTLR